MIVTLKPMGRTCSSGNSRVFISKVGANKTANDKKDKNHHWSGYFDSSRHVAISGLLMNEWANE